MEIKAAIFDMDGTLVDSLILWSVFWKELGKRYLGDENFSPSEEDDKAVRTMTMKEVVSLIHERYNIAESEEELFSVVNEIMVDFYGNSVELKPGVKEFLEHLYSKGTKMCIASATDSELINLAVKHCNIGKYFSKIISCATLGYGKDRPDIFLSAHNFLNAPVCDIWVFEDSLTAIKTAKKLGMQTVGIFDKNNYGQEEISKLSKIYIADGETLEKLIN